MPHWYQEIRAGQLKVRLVQCDLAKHSKWFEESVREGLGPLATDAKKDLAVRFEAAISPAFAPIYWRGDGGLYAAKQEGVTGDDVVNAARAIRQAYTEWRNATQWSSLHLDHLSLRVSCHTCDVWIDPEESYWSSVDLNRFVKYERNLTHEETIGITQAVFEDLRNLRDSFASNSRQVWLEEPKPVVWTMYYDLTITPETLVGSTVDWFVTKFGAARNDPELTIQSLRFTLGNAAVLRISGSPEDSLSVDLEQIEPRSFGELETIEAWKTREERVLKELSTQADPGKQVDRERACPVTLRLPIKDFPTAKITYFPVKYSKARSFLWLLEQDRGIWRSIASKGVDYLSEHLPRPGLLVAQIAVITDQPDQGPHVVLAQRSTRFPTEVGFYGGLWSASVDEQVDKADGTVREAVERGLREELLGRKAQEATLHVAALFLERSILNLAIGVVCRTSLTYEEVYDLWRDSEDRDEHQQIVALPLEANLIEACVREGQITEAARERCLVHPSGRATWQQTDGWQLHPTSALRLGLALWVVQGRP